LKPAAWLEELQSLAACRPSLRIGTEHAANAARAREAGGGDAG
jgi:hypothetical protein